MRYMRVFVLVLVFASLSLSCSEMTDQPLSERTVRSLTPSEKALASSGNTFGLNLFREIARDPELEGRNMFISPLSVSYALGMTLNGAGGETREAMVNTLELEGFTPEEANESYRSLTDYLVNLDPTVRFQMANSIWYRDDFSVIPSFMDLNRAYFHAEVDGLDFSDPAASETINGWVKDATGGKIESIVPQQIPREAVMYLINAIYFKGAWRYQFDPEKTMDAPFQLLGGSEVGCSMMYQKGTFSMSPGQLFSALDMPYGDSLYSMTILLPEEAVTTDEVILWLNDASWQSVVNGLSPVEIEIYLPRFKLEFERSLKKDLAGLGMGVAFTSDADFSRMTDEKVFISEVLHKTFVEVNEEGTEAAAATSVEISRTSLSPVFRVDRPFVFAIRENRSGTILFIGRIAYPEQM